MLQGLSNPGLAFKFDSDAYGAQRGVHTADMPPQTAASLLARFATLGTHLHHLQRFFDAILRPAPGESGTVARLRTLPTIAALAAALSRHLLGIKGQVAALESEALGTDAEVPAADSVSLSLINLQLRTRMFACQLTAMQRIVEQCSWQGSAAATAAAALDAVQQALDAAALEAGSQGGVVYGMLADIFVSACTPYLDAVDTWLSSGSLEGAPPEVFISEGEQGTFVMQRRADGTVAAPAMLRQCAEAILDAGLAVHDLQRSGDSAVGDWGLHAHADDRPQPLSAAFAAKVSTYLERRAGENAVSCEEMRLSDTIGQRVDPPAEVGTAAVEVPGSCTREWTAAVSKAGTAHAADGMTTCDDLPDIPSLHATVLDLPAASGINFDALNACGGHPIGRAMQHAAARRCDQAAAYNRPDLDFLDISVPNFLHVAASKAEEQAHLATSAQEPFAAEFDGSWSEWFTKTAAELTNEAPFGASTSVIQALQMHDAKWTVRGSYWTEKEAAGMPHSPLLWAGAPPFQVVLEECLLAPLSARIADTGAKACSAVLSSGLLPQLASLRSVVAMATPELESFAQMLLVRCSTSHGVDAVSPAELNAALQMAIDASSIALPNTTSAMVTIQPAGASSMSAGPVGVPCSVRSLARISLVLQPGFPLSLVADAEFLRSHAAVSTLLLQLRWVEQSLFVAMRAEWKEGASQRRVQHALQHEMLHLALSTHQHIVTQMDAAGVELERRLKACTSLTEVRQRCAAYRQQMEEACLVAPSGFSAGLHSKLVAALDCALQHCILLRQSRRLQLAAAAGRAAAGAGEASSQGVGSPANPQMLGVDALERLGQLRSALQSVQREYPELRCAFMGLLVSRAGEAGAHSEGARALLAVLDPSSWYARDVA